jgi:hypothetical protein
MGDAASSLTLTRSELWRTALAARDGDPDAEVRSFFREHLLRLRKKAAYLVAQTAKDIPQLTVHDITHLDAFWEIAALIAGPGYQLNPAEAYVFGAAVLLHDAAMSLAAYPNGLAGIQQTDEWRDAVASLPRVSDSDDRQHPIDAPPDVLRAVIPDVLRALHARHAAELPTAKWRATDGSGFEFLIDDSEIRSCYGPVIGRIARSHNDPVSSLPRVVGNQIGAFCDAPSDWVVDPVRLASLLRCADAAHIDHRRAPHFLQLLVSPERVSALHWTFQAKLAKPRVEEDALVFSSGPDFCLDEADAWWLCFETVRIIDRELREVDRLFENTGRCRFAVRRVIGAESPLALAAHVRTRGWEPVDAQLKVSDVRQIVTLFGGRHLYGDSDLVPIRELIQNGADAIRARYLLQPGFSEHANVTVRVIEADGSFWLEVQDNGVGMSRRTLTDSLLDFGRSFWNSSAVREEFAGLLGKGLSTTGRFGVGFFSVFMLGDTVRVTSRRYDAALDSALTLEFRSGVEVRPIIHRADNVESLPEGGTRVCVRLKNSPYEKGGFLARSAVLDFTSFKFDFRLGQIERIDLAEALGPLCPSIDVCIRTEENGNPAKLCIDADDWLTINPEVLLRRIGLGSDGSIRHYAPLVRPLADANGTYGRACVHGVGPMDFGHGLSGVVTVGGLLATRLSHVAGVLKGSTNVISRQSAIPIVPSSVLRCWAREQADLISASALHDAGKLRAAAVVLRCGAEPGGLPIATRDGEYLNASQLRDAISRLDEVVVFDDEDVSYDEDTDACHPKQFEKDFEPASDIFFVSKSKPNMFAGTGTDWPDSILNDGQGQAQLSCLQFLERTISLAWGADPEEHESEQVVGTVISTEIVRSVSVFVKPDGH